MSLIKWPCLTMSNVPLWPATHKGVRICKSQLAPIGCLRPRPHPTGTLCFSPTSISALSPNAHLCTLVQLCHLDIPYWLFEAMGVPVLVPDRPGSHDCFDAHCSPNTTATRLFPVRNAPESATRPGPWSPAQRATGIAVWLWGIELTCFCQWTLGKELLDSMPQFPHV